MSKAKNFVCTFIVQRNKSKDPTIAKLFNTYKFANYKEQVIDLLDRVYTISVKMMEII